MPPISIEVFSEGKTEEQITKKLTGRRICLHKLEERGGGSDRELLRKFKLRLQEWVRLEPRDPLRVLVMRDFDEHLGQTIEGLCDSLLNRVRQHDPSASLVPHPDHDNVFSLQTGLGGLSLALHVATDRYLADFAKTTIDDYVLRLALLPTTVEILLQQAREGGERSNPRRAWSATRDGWIEKVRREVPALLENNGIPRLREAKQYLRFYSVLMQEHTSPATFAPKIVEHAREDDIREVFAALLAAIQLLSDDNL